MRSVEFSRFAWCPFALMVVQLLAIAPIVQGQTITGNIVGTVTDSTNAIVPGATVTLKNQDTGVVQERAADGKGYYTFRSVRPGTYTVTVHMSGFTTSFVQNVVVRVDQTARVDLALKPGGVSETVEVEAAAPLVSSTTSELGEVIEKEQIQALPLNGRFFGQLVSLTPGALPSGPTDEPENPAAAGVSVPTTASVNGLPYAGTVYTLDGVYNMEPLSGYISTAPPVEAIEEFKVQTNNPSAQYGSFGGAIVNLTTRSGTNTLHGSAFDYYRNNKLDARDYFSRPEGEKLKVDSHQFGATLGGPILKNKLFFFVDYEGLRQLRGRRYRMIVPTAAMRNGDFSGTPDVIDPLTGQPFPNNQIQHDRMDPVAAQMAGVYPLPNYTDPDGVFNFMEANDQRNDKDAFDVRLDYEAGNDRLFVRYSRAERSMRSPSPGNRFINSGDDTVNSDSTTQNLVLGYTRAFGSNLLNEFRAGYNKYDTFHYGGDYGVDKNNELGIPNGNLAGHPETSGIANLWFDNSGIQSTGSPDWTDGQRLATTYQVTDTLTWIKNKHTVRFGAEVLRLESTLTNPELNPRGFFEFDGRYSGNDFADFLLGYPYVYGRGIVATTPKVVMWNIGGFVQDDIQVATGFTLNLGLRWDIYTPPYENDNKQANFNLQDGRLHLADSSNRGPDVDTFKNGFAPRIGFAYTPDSGKTAVRGAFGISYFRDIYGASGGTLEKNYPFIQSISHEDSAGVPFARMSVDGLPSYPPQQAPGGTITPPAGITVFTVPRDFRPDQAMMWNIGVQRQIYKSAVVELTYVGTRGSHLFRSYRINLASSPGPGDIDPRRPYYSVAPQIQDIRSRESTGKSQYHSVQAKYTQRIAKGLQGLLSYTWSRSRDNLAVFWPYDDSMNWGPSYWWNVDTPHNVVVSLSYELPFGPGKPLLSNASGVTRALVERWTISAIGAYRSGDPLTINVSGDGLNVGRSNINRADLVCPDVSMPKTTDEWFDTSCFARPAQYTFGNSPQGVVRGPSYINLDASLSKRTSLGTRATFELRIDVFNVTNTPHFYDPATRLGSSTFGQITGAYGYRQFQLGARILF